MFERASQAPKPDVIVAHDPPQVNGHFGLRLARKHGVPLVVDTVDLWPEFFVRAMPKAIRPMAQIAALPLFAWRKRNWRAAAAYTSLARPYLDVVLDVADPERRKPAVVAYNGIDVAEFRSHLSGDELENLPPKQPNEIRAVFAGTLGPSYDVPAMLAAARRAEKECPQLRLVIAGDGPYRPDVEARAQEGKNVLYAGKLAVDRLVRLYASCDIGLCAYGPFSNVEMPDKIYDYTAAGLAVVNSLVGEVRGFIEREKIGLNYQAGDGDDLFLALSRLAEDDKAMADFKVRSWNVGEEFENAKQIAGLADMIEKVATKG
jgi:glycosyltransferase involved in cell wall biosynthesis